MLLQDLIEEPEVLLQTLPEPVAAQWRILSQEPLGVFTQWDRAEQLLCEAQKQLPHQLSLAEALYKLYAYSNQFEKALFFIRWVFHVSSKKCALPADPLQTGPEHTWYAPLTRDARYYLYAVKAYAFVTLRQGLLNDAYALVQKLALLDPKDQVGGSVVAALAQRLMDEER